MAILNPYSKTTYVNGTAPDLNATNLNKNEQGVYDVTEKVRELAAYETNAAASAVSAASSASAAAASAAVYTDLATVVANKANKVQSEWIEPTMINNWVNFGEGYDTFAYMKDEFGFVHIKGIIKGGTAGSSNFTMPVGYRPQLNKIFPIVSNALPLRCTIMSTGVIVLTGTSNASVCFGEIIYKV